MQWNETYDGGKLPFFDIQITDFKDLDRVTSPLF